VAFVGYMALNNSRKKKAALVQKAAIEPGVHVMTSFGMYGTVRGVDDDSVLLEIDENVLVRVNKRAVGTVVADPTDSFDPADLDGHSHDHSDHSGHDHDDHDDHEGHEGHDHSEDESDADELAEVGSDDLAVADPAPPAAGTSTTTDDLPADTPITVHKPGATTGHDEGPGPVPTR
jgi:preprotein translocase subunit YajC